jgi:hypothetical protein
MHFGPNDILVNMTVKFPASTTMQEMVQSVGKIEQQIRDKIPQVKRVFIEAASLSAGEVRQPPAA